MPFTATVDSVEELIPDQAGRCAHPAVTALPGKAFLLRKCQKRATNRQLSKGGTDVGKY
jgi:hypothetical protein